MKHKSRYEAEYIFERKLGEKLLVNSRTGMRLYRYFFIGKDDPIICPGVSSRANDFQMFGVTEIPKTNPPDSHWVGKVLNLHIVRNPDLFLKRKAGDKAIFLTFAEIGGPAALRREKRRK